MFSPATTQLYLILPLVNIPAYKNKLDDKDTADEQQGKSASLF